MHSLWQGYFGGEVGVGIGAGLKVRSGAVGSGVITCDSVGISIGVSVAPSCEVIFSEVITLTLDGGDNRIVVMLR